MVKNNNRTMKRLSNFENFNENMLPKSFPKTKCLECGEEVCDTINQKIWHLYNKHFKKSTVGEWEEQELLKKYFK